MLSSSENVHFMMRKQKFSYAFLCTGILIQSNTLKFCKAEKMIGNDAKIATEVQYAAATKGGRQPSVVSVVIVEFDIGA